MGAEAVKRELPSQYRGLIPWKPGQSGNPGGRPKGLASYIRENSMDGRELADFLLSVLRGTSPFKFSGNDRIRACELLLDRAFGKTQMVELDPNLKPVLDLDKMSEEELGFIENVRLGLVAIRERIARSEASSQSP